MWHAPHGCPVWRAKLGNAAAVFIVAILTKEIVAKQKVKEIIVLSNRIRLVAGVSLYEFEQHDLVAERITLPPTPISRRPTCI